MIDKAAACVVRGGIWRPSMQCDSFGVCDHNYPPHERVGRVEERLLRDSPGATSHITMELIAKQLGIKWVPVPIKGGAEAINALLGGHVDAQVDSSGWGPQVNAGQLRLLVTWGAARTESWPTVPTLKETGIDMVVNSPYGIAGPKGMDANVARVLHASFKKGMEEPSFRATLAKFDQEVWYLSSEDYEKYVQREIAEQKRIVEVLGLKQE